MPPATAPGAGPITAQHAAAHRIGDSLAPPIPASVEIVHQPANVVDLAIADERAVAADLQVTDPDPAGAQPGAPAELRGAG